MLTSKNQLCCGQTPNLQKPFFYNFLRFNQCAINLNIAADPFILTLCQVPTLRPPGLFIAKTIALVYKQYCLYLNIYIEQIKAEIPSIFERRNLMINETKTEEFKISKRGVKMWQRYK